MAPDRASSSTIFCRKTEPISLFFSVLLMCNLFVCVVQNEHNWIGKASGASERIKLRSLGVKHQKQTGGIADEGYLTDNRQEAVSPKQLGGIVIQTESERLSAGLRWITNDEIGITKMQVRIYF